MTSPGVAVVLCTRDRPELLRGALEALVPALRPQDEAVVVDSASSGPESRVVAERLGLRVVRCDRPGLSRARNAGVAATSRPVVAFTDDDCRPDPRWPAVVERAFTDPHVGLVTGRVLAVGQGTGTRLSTRDATAPRRFRGPTRPGLVGHGANMALRRTALDQLGGFDELLGAGGPLRAADDWDVFWRVLRLGWEAVYEPDSVVTHDQWRTRRAALRVRYGYALGAGALGVKALRLSDPLGRRILADRLLRQGAERALRGLVRRRPELVLDAAANLAGGLVGAARGLRLPIEAGQFAERPGR